MQKIAIIIPCYNEGKRLQKKAFTDFLSTHEDTVLFFVNDGSSDNTSGILDSIRSKSGHQVRVISLEKNGGKANAVRTGLIESVSENEFAYTGYLDADLSTSPQEFYRLFLLMKEKNLDYIFGSRIKMINTSVKRSQFRHIAGRLIATTIDSKFKLGIYDTQCGAKCFKSEVIRSVCKKPFITKWFFDVEIFLRIKKELPDAKGIEVPLQQWEDAPGSKINIFSFPSVLKEIILLRLKYSK
jgi:dolichyl-phosphate beta-glucosyltransferase